jgi:hypothetical protein
MGPRVREDDTVFLTRAPIEIGTQFYRHSDKADS